jgi:hypothetical protein
MPPKPLGKNTATREYYGIDKTDAHIDWPSSQESSRDASPQEKAASLKGQVAQTSADQDATKIAGESEAEHEPPSPTPSGIVLAADFEGFGPMSDEITTLIGEGVNAEERKERLLELKAILERERRESTMRRTRVNRKKGITWEEKNTAK